MSNDIRELIQAVAKLQSENTILLETLEEIAEKKESFSWAMHGMKAFRLAKNALGMDSDKLRPIPTTPDDYQMDN